MNGFTQPSIARQGGMTLIELAVVLLAMLKTRTEYRPLREVESVA